MTKSIDDKALTLVRKRTATEDLFGDAGNVAASIVESLRKAGRKPSIPLETVCTAYVELMELVTRDFYSGSMKPTHVRCFHCVQAAGNTERAWLDADQLTLDEMRAHAAKCPSDPVLAIVVERQEAHGARDPATLRHENTRLRALVARAAVLLETDSDQAARTRSAETLRKEYCILIEAPQS